MTLFNDTSNIGSIFMSFLLVQARDFMSCSATQNLHGNFLSLATLLNFELQTRLVNYVKANVHTWEVNISFFLEENLKFKFLVWNSKTWPRKCGHWIDEIASLLFFIHVFYSLGLLTTHIHFLELTS